MADTSPAAPGQSHMTHGTTFGSAVPPPLTPPHKGEGDLPACSPSTNHWRFRAVWRPQSPPPPCGEGLGVGVSSYAIAPPTSSTTGRCLPRPRFPKLAASLKALPGLIGDAFRMAYVDPYASRRRPRAAPDDALGGRDPGW